MESGTAAGQRDLDLLTTKEVAALLRVPIKTVHYWREVKKGPRGAKLGRHVLYERAEVIRWWNEQLALD